MVTIRKHRLKAVLAALALGLIALFGTSSAASAAPAVTAVTGYHLQTAIGCSTGACSDDVRILLHTTNDTNHVWINGSVSASPSGGDIVTWRGVGGGNGTSDLNVGVNFTKNGRSFYYRVDLHSVNGSQWCSTSGNVAIAESQVCFG